MSYISKHPLIMRQYSLKHGEEAGEDLIPSVLYEGPMTLSVSPLCPLFGSVLHINMLEHMLLKLHVVLDSRFDWCCVCRAHSGQRERERETVCKMDAIHRDRLRAH